MKLTLEHSNSVNGHGRFVAMVLLVLLDYQRNTVEELRSADVENAIVDRLTDAAFGTITEAGGPGLKELVRRVYQNYRPGTAHAKTTPLFFRPNNMLQIAFSIISAAGSDIPVAKVAEEAPQLHTVQTVPPSQPATPAPPQPAGPPPALQPQAPAGGAPVAEDGSAAPVPPEPQTSTPGPAVPGGKSKGKSLGSVLGGGGKGGGKKGTK